MFRFASTSGHKLYLWTSHVWLARWPQSCWGRGSGVSQLRDLFPLVAVRMLPLIRCLHTDCAWQECRTGQRQPWWKRCKCQGRRQSPGLSELIPSARYTNPGLSECGSCTPKDELRVCLCQDQKAITARAHLYAFGSYRSRIKMVRGWDTIVMAKSRPWGEQLDRGAACCHCPLCDLEQVSQSQSSSLLILRWR